MPQSPARLTLVLCLTVAIFSGCADDSSRQMPVLPALSQPPAESERSIREVNATELQELVAAGDRPILVEFSVLSGCYRCDEMRSPLRRQLPEIMKHADVVRVNYNRNPTLLREVGATVCPSYAVFAHGEVVSVRSWPTSADFVAQDVLAAVEGVVSATP